MGIAAAVLMGLALIGAGCKPPSHPVPIDQVKVPAGFDFATAKDVTVKVTVADGSGNVRPGSVVTVGSSQQELVSGNILARGITDAQGQFERVVRVPARYDALRVKALIFGVGHSTDASIEDNAVSVSFGPES
jgi:hypothetical protein